MKGLFPLLLDSSFFLPLPFRRLLAHRACLCVGTWGTGEGGLATMHTGPTHSLSTRHYHSARELPHCWGLGQWMEVGFRAGLWDPETQDLRPSAKVGAVGGRGKMGKGGWETEPSSLAPPSALRHVPPPTPVSPVSFSGTPGSPGLALRMLMKECLPGVLVRLSSLSHPPHPPGVCLHLPPLSLAHSLRLALGLSLFLPVSLCVSFSLPSLTFFPLGRPIFPACLGCPLGAPSLTLGPSSLSVLPPCPRGLLSSLPPSPLSPCHLLLLLLLELQWRPGSRLLPSLLPGKVGGQRESPADDSRAPASLGAVTEEITHQRLKFKLEFC